MSGYSNQGEALIALNDKDSVIEDDVDNLSVDLAPLRVSLVEELLVDFLFNLSVSLNSVALGFRHLSVGDGVDVISSVRGSRLDVDSNKLSILVDLWLEVGKYFTESFMSDLFWDVLKLPVVQQEFLREVTLLWKSNNSANTVVNLIQLSLEVLSLVINNATQIRLNSQ